MIWFLDKKTNTAGIFGGVSALIKSKAIESEYKSALTEAFSRRKETSFENESYRIEKMNLITTGTKKKNN